MSVILSLALLFAPAPAPSCACGQNCPVSTCEGGSRCRCASSHSLTRSLLARVFAHDLRALGDDDFDARERAEAKLTHLGGLVYHVLPVDSRDLEVRRRARRIQGRVIPDVCPPIALLAGTPLPEWGRADSEAIALGARPRGEGWYLTWLRPDVNAPWLGRRLINHYGERARSQNLWKDWQSDSDGRIATRMLVEDLLRVGLPPEVIRRGLEVLREREERLVGK